MTRDHFAAIDAPLQNEDIVICKRVFDHICATGHIKGGDACDELATQIIYFYQHGVTNEDSLEQLLARVANKQRQT